jgi:hypothetical protein
MSYGIENGICREPAQIVMHLPEGWTRVLLVRTYRLGLADGGIYWDIPVAKIPIHLRDIGSVFLIETPLSSSWEAWMANSEERHSRRYEGLRISELPREEAVRFSGRIDRF